MIIETNSMAFIVIFCMYRKKEKKKVIIIDQYKLKSRVCSLLRR